MLINGMEYKDAEELNLQATIVIQFHSEQQASDGQIKISTDSKTLEGKDYISVVKILTEEGFAEENIQVIALEDLSNNIFRNNEKVKSVSIGGILNFSVGDIFPKDAPITVSYHSYKPEETTTVPTYSDDQVLMTIASKNLKGMDCQDVVDILNSFGFYNIDVVPLGDLNKGWIYKDGEVKEVVIDGNSKFSVNDVFDKNAKITVSYHSYPN